MTDLIKNREGNLVSNTHRECTNHDCRKIFRKTSKTVTLCPECNNQRVKRIDPVKRMFARAKSRSKQKNWDFSIDLEDILIPEYCPVLNVKLECYEGRGGVRNNSPSLDRIDNSKGYIKGNVRVICTLANLMKSSASKEELKKFAKWIEIEFPD